MSYNFFVQVYVASVVGMFRVVEGAACVARIADSKFHRHHSCCRGVFTRSAKKFCRKGCARENCEVSWIPQSSGKKMR